MSPLPQTEADSPSITGSPWRQAGELPALLGLWAILIASMSPFWRGSLPWDPDVALHFLPLKVIGASLLREGQLPLWTSLVGLGYPLLADPEVGLLYPPEVAFYLAFAPSQALLVSMVFHALLGSGLFYAFGRRLGLARSASVVGALVFSYAGPFVTLLGSPRMLVAAWWPAVLIAIDGVARASSPAARLRWTVLGAVAVALLLLAGGPQTASLGMLLAGSFSLYSVRAQSRRSRMVILSACAVMVILGGSLAAPQLFATLEIIPSTARAEGIGSQAGFGSLFPPAIVSMVTPNWRFAATLRSESPNGYVGILALALGALAVVRRRSGARFWLLMAVVAVVLAFGRFTPLFWLTSQVPVLGSFRVPARYLYIAVAALAVLAAIGADTLAELARQRRAIRPLARIGLLLAAVVLAIDLITAAALRFLADPIYALVSRFAGGGSIGGQAATSEFFTAALAATGAAEPRLWLPLVGFTGLAALLGSLRRFPRAAPAIVVATVAVESLLLGGPVINPSLTLSQESQTVALVRQLAPGRIYSFGEPYSLASSGHYSVLPAGLNALYGIPSIGLYSALGDPAYAGLTRGLGAVNLGRDVSVPTQMSLSANRRLLDLLGVSAILSPVPLADLGPATEVSGAYVYINPSAFPRAWIVAELVAGREELGALTAPDLDLSSVALVGEPTLQGQYGAKGPARVLHEDGTSISVEAAGPGLLVLADRWAPEWRADVDGDVAPVWPVNGVMRGVALPPGRHVVTFIYASMGHRIGGLVAAGSILLAGALLIVSVWVRRLPAPAQALL